jgi:hypothetical protein
MKAALMCLMLDKGAIAHALDPPACDEVADDAVAHASSPASTMRVPVQRDADHRSTERIYGSGRFHPRAAAATIST